MRRQPNRKRLEIAKGKIAKRDVIEDETRLQWRTTQFKVNFLGCVTLKKQITAAAVSENQF